ncbi:SulP family inorganic anion transporter [Corynebacterium pacaense]|uniref:SulP family inorganic anion transporter n=1 Tax=Corynebacterium pacaense TaxID=1816684 RepID=UPI0009BB2337|nr:SulP family inorganic anion transporter [Corynebacterium pacaense]
MTTRAWFLPTLRGVRTSLSADILAGLTLAAIAIPGSMAAAQLLGVSPALGLLGFSIATLVFTLLGAHRTLSVGPDTTIAPMLAAGAAGTAVTATHQPADADPGSIMLISLMTGLLLLGIGVIRGGWITQFLSRPVTIGLMAGIGISIIASQLTTVLGMEGKTSGNVPEQLYEVAVRWQEINVRALGLAIGVLIIGGGARLFSSRFPGALLGLVVASVVAAVSGFERYGVRTLDAPDSVWKVPDFSVVPWASAWDLLPSALVIALLITVQTGATEETTRQGHGTLDRDLAAVGAASIVAAAAGAFAVNSSPPRTRLVYEAGGRTQLSSISAAIIVSGVLLLGTGLLSVLPVAALAAVLLQIAFSLIRVKELRRIAAFSRMELMIALGTVVLVCVMGIVQGVAVAALVTLLDRTRREARPPVYRKGLIPQSNHWVPVDVGVDTVQVPEVLVWSVEAPIWYADADFVLERIHNELDHGDYSVVVLDAAAISDLDYTGVLAMGTLISHLEDEKIPVLIARATRPTQKALRRSGLMDKVSLFPTVADAVKKGVDLAGLRPEFRAARAKKKDLAALASEGLNPEEVIEEDDHH